MEIMNVFSLPRGFGFYPTDEELVSHYLKRKSLGQKIDHEIIPEVDIYKLEPWDLPAKCHVPTHDSKWHFFSTRDRKYPNGSRANRATEAGYWKSTGKDRRIKSNNRVVGTKKTLVFHKGRPPSGKRTDWIMHEYHLDENEYKASPGRKDAFVLCRVTKRDGLVQEAEVSSKIDGYANQPKGMTVLAAQGDVDDVKAWIEELYDPNFCSIPAITELQGNDDLIAPKWEVDNPCSPTNISEDSVHFPPETDKIKCFLEKDIPEFDIDRFFGEYGTAVALDDILTPSEAAELGENPIHYNSLTSFNVVGSHGSDFICENGDNTKNTRNEKTGIQIRPRRPGFSTTVTKERIKLQTHKMVSRNEKTINGTVECVNEDHHLEFKIGGDDPERPASIQPVNKSYIKGLNILFLAGVFALILYFLLHVASLSSGVSSSSEL